MSHQPFPGQPGPPQPPPYGAPPAGPAPYVQQPSAPFAPTAPKGQRRRGLIVAGTSLILLGIVGGGALLVTGGTNYEDAVKDLARAPVGCTTSLEFDKTGTFTIYVETEGEVGDLRGDCANSDASYSRDADDLPDVDLVLTNEDGDEIEIEDDDGEDYDAADFVGTSIGRIEIEEEGSYELTVTSDEDEFAIAIGKDPKENAALAGIGLIVLIAGLILGLVLLILGLRRKTAPSGSTPGQGFDGGPPTGYVPQQPQYAPTMQHPTVPPQSYPPQTFPPQQPSYGPPPTAPLPVTPPPPTTPGSWNPPPPQT